MHKWLILVVYRSPLSLVMTLSIDKPAFLLMLPNSKTKGNGSRTTKQYPQEICTRFCCVDNKNTWWRHQMETFSALLTLCVGSWPVTGEFPSQRPVTRSFGVFFDLHLNKRLSKQWWGRWFETPSCPLWRHCNEHIPTCFVVVVLEVFCWFIYQFTHFIQCCFTSRIGAEWRIYTSINFPSLVQIMVCRLAGAKPLSESIL